ncbi:hypothetical protein K7462_30760, partial [Pseudomonas fluorescens]|uniref:hypothetical protein n=1 Tax=Pseudomonas fluorescens TaxID=294 RepID=UPI001CA6DB45
RWIDRLKINIPIDYGALSVLIVIVFACIAIAACLTADHVPLFSALGGVSGPELAMYRNEFLRGRHGSGQLLNYGFAILSQGLMPLALTYGFWSGARWRYLALIVFTFCSALTLSKAAILLIAAPLLALF